MERSWRLPRQKPKQRRFDILTVSNTERVVNGTLVPPPPRFICDRSTTNPLCCKPRAFCCKSFCRFSRARFLSFNILTSAFCHERIVPYSSVNSISFRAANVLFPPHVDVHFLVLKMFLHTSKRRGDEFLCNVLPILNCYVLARVCEDYSCTRRREICQHTRECM